MPPARAHQPIFVWATGQLDNIGDSLLRRPYLATLRSAGSLHIWVRDSDESFLSGLGLCDEDSIYRSFWDWIGAALRSSVLRRTTIALNAGEVPVSRSGSLRIASLALVALIARVRGGGLVWLGVGVPPPTSRFSRFFTLPYRWAARMAFAVRARDEESLRTLRSAEVAPDWAFNLGTPTERWRPPEDRSLLVVSLRGDRAMPSTAWLSWVRHQASQNGLEILVLSQVRRDNPRTKELGEILGGITLQFEVEDHSVQEGLVRSVYERARFTISDRLHVLIVSATEGSVPVGWIPSSTGKVRRHFDAVGMQQVGRYEGALHTDWPEIGQGSDQPVLSSSIDSVRNQLSVSNQRFLNSYDNS